VSSKRQTTFAKAQRELAVKERRARKLQRKQERSEEKRRHAEDAALAPVDGGVEQPDPEPDAPAEP
jgi:hypothetical protein